MLNVASTFLPRIIHYSICRCPLALFRRITRMRMSFFAVRSRRFLVVISRVIVQFLSKLLERVVSVQLTHYLSLAGRLPLPQSAYRKFHLTKVALALLKVLTDLIDAIDVGDHASLCLLDLSAAFDTVDHDALTKRLTRTYGLRPTALDWLRSYLLDRRQSVFYDGVSSSVSRLVCGVPQGSVLGPPLFLLYTTDVGELAASLGLSSHFYADGSQLYTWGHPSPDGLQQSRMELVLQTVPKSTQPIIY